MCDDKVVFHVTVNLTPAKLKKRTQEEANDLRIEDIPRLFSTCLTKRSLLGFFNRQYDPMGLIAPLEINLRELFGPGVDLGWDERLPQKLHKRWIGILTMFIQMEEIIISRAVRPAGVEDIPEQIGFSDGLCGCDLH